MSRPWCAIRDGVRFLHDGAKTLRGEEVLGLIYKPGAAAPAPGRFRELLIYLGRYQRKWYRSRWGTIQSYIFYEVL